MPQEETITAFSCLALKRIISLVTWSQLWALVWVPVATLPPGGHLAFQGASALCDLHETKRSWRITYWLLVKSFYLSVTR